MKRTLLNVFVLIASFFAFSLVSNSTVQAATTDNITGWAWSANIGWISFNCTNEVGSCATSNYGVNKNADGTLTGYAWSSSVGWIQFGGLTGFPTGTGTYAQNAQVVGTAVRGWIKATSLGDDGWISLWGETPAYGVSLTSIEFTGYAWGNDPSGWISWNCSNEATCATADYKVQLSGDANFDVQNSGISLSGNNDVPYGTLPTFIWTITNLPSVDCTISKTSPGGTSFTPITGITSSGTSTSSGALTDAAYTYSLDCTNPTISKQISFTVDPQPPGFSIGGTGAVNIQILNAGEAQSDQDLTNVAAIGGYTNPVSISITGFPTPPASTTYTYSFNGGSSYSDNPSAFVINSPYSTGLPFKIKVTRLVGAPAITDPFTVTLTGTGAGAPNASKNIVITPVIFDPTYEEH